MTDTQDMNRRTLRFVLLILAAAALGWLSGGCVVASRSHVRSDSWTTNKTGEVVHESRHTETPWVLAFGDAKAFIEKLRLSNGKTHTIGMSGFEAESTTTNVPALLRAGGELIGTAAAEFIKKSTTGGIAP